MNMELPQIPATPITPEVHEIELSGMLPAGTAGRNFSVNAPSAFKLNKTWGRALTADGIRVPFDMRVILGGLFPVSPFVSQSSISCWMDCHRKFLFKYRYGLSRRNIRSEALDIGSMYHKIIAARYLGATPEEACAQGTLLLRESLESCAELASSNPARYAEIANRLEKNLVMARVLVEAFLKRYPLPPTFRTLAVELRIVAKRVGLAVPLKGTIDQLVYNEDNGELWIVDHKTVGRGDLHERATTTDFEVQPQMYRVLLEGAMSQNKALGIPKGAVLAGFVHNLIKKPSINIRATESYEDYMARVNAWYEEPTESPRIGQVWQRFVRNDLAALELQTVFQEVSKASVAPPRLPVFFKNPASCMRNGSPCEFLALCSSNSNLMPRLISEKYVAKVDQASILGDLYEIEKHRMDAHGGQADGETI